MTITIDQDTCTGCAVCADVCPAGVIRTAKDGRPVVRDDADGTCIACGHCEAFCPTGALLTRPAGVSTPLVADTSLSPERLATYLMSRRSVRHYLPGPVPRETIEALLEVARFAPSGGNGQPVEWLVVHDPEQVRTIAGLAIDWMRGLSVGDHPMSGRYAGLVTAWDCGTDVICRGAPHLLVPHVPAGNPIAPTDAVIALTHVDVVAPAFGLGTCWAGFVAMASWKYAPLREFLSLPAGREPAYAMMLGRPRYTPVRIPERRPLRVTWMGSGEAEEK